MALKLNASFHLARVSIYLVANIFLLLAFSGVLLQSESKSGTHTDDSPLFWEEGGWERKTK